MVHQGPDTRGGSFFRSPYVPEETGQNLEGFMEIADDSLSHSRWIAIFDAVGKGTFDDEEGATHFILEDKTGGVDQKGPVNTQFKLPRFGINDFNTDTLDAGELNEQHWAMIGDNFKTTGICLLNMNVDKALLYSVGR